MKLTVMNRITLSGLLPLKANFLNHMLIEEARKVLSFSEVEHKALQFRTLDGGKVTWNETQLTNKETGKTVPKNMEQGIVERMVMAEPDNFEMRPTVDEVELEFGDVVTRLICEALKALNEAEALDMNQLALYKKFIKSS